MAVQGNGFGELLPAGVDAVFVKVEPEQYASRLVFVFMDDDVYYACVECLGWRGRVDFFDVFRYASYPHVDSAYVYVGKLWEWSRGEDLLPHFFYGRRAPGRVACDWCRVGSCRGRDLVVWLEWRLELCLRRCPSGVGEGSVVVDTGRGGVGGVSPPQAVCELSLVARGDVDWHGAVGVLWTSSRCGRVPHLRPGLSRACCAEWVWAGHLCGRFLSWRSAEMVLGG